MTTPLFLVKQDANLAMFEGKLNQRHQSYLHKLGQLSNQRKCLGDFALGHLYYGMQEDESHYIFREWAPNAIQIFLSGTFNNWQEEAAFQFTKISTQDWELRLPKSKLKHGDLYHLRMHWVGGLGNRIPAYARRVVQDADTKIFSAQVWLPKPYIWKHQAPKTQSKPLIYEAHIGMSGEEARVATYREFQLKVLPRIQKAGYNTIQLMAIQEHPYYGSFGYHVSSFFAPSSRFGTPEELKELVDTAHSMGLRVIMDIVHSHAVKNTEEGLGLYDGTTHQFFHTGSRGQHPAWDSLCFDYAKEGVLHFLLSNLHYWMKEFQFDGFRFDGVTSMLYLDHGLERDFCNYEAYFDGGQDEDAITYLCLANKLIHELNPQAMSIAEEMSGMPGLAAKLEDGGYGFDYRMAMGVPDFWIKTIKEQADEDWKVGHIFYELTNKRAEEEVISYVESHDQAMVGDKTVIFRLIDKEMYFHMEVHDPNMVVERGIALHKLIRLITLSTAGGGYLNFMGNEFGHPEWIDFPRKDNDWSYLHARRQWSLVDNPNLKFQYLGQFDQDIIRLIQQHKVLEESYIQKIWDKDQDQVLAYERNKLLFVFNFNPSNSFSDYGIFTSPGRYKIRLSSDDSVYGGQVRIDTSLDYFTSPSSKEKHQLQLYLPARTAIVLELQK